jgi:hypothetical protein
MENKLLSAFLIAISISVSYAQGYYMEFKMSMGNASSSAGGVMKTWHQDGNTRTEVSMLIQNTNRTIVNLMLKSAPDKLYSLSPEQKTYVEADINKSDASGGDQPTDYEITVLGKEKVNGYNTTHVKILNIKKKTEQDYWTSTEVAGYSDYMKIKTKYTGNAGLTSALTSKGALGFPVRIKGTERAGTFQLDLVKADKQGIPASLFSLDGYTKAGSSTSQSSSAPASQQEMIQKMQNMTPEERQKYIQQMVQQKQQNQPH